MLRLVLLGLLLGVLGNSAQILQCPDTFPEECSCDEFSMGVDITCVTISMETWDIQSTFDAVSVAFNNTDEPIYFVNMNPRLVTSPDHEVPAHSIRTLKTQNLYLFAAYTYTRIDPNAFSGTHSTTEYLQIFDMDFQNTTEAFELFNNFRVLRGLYLYGHTLSQIPAHAFDLQSLEYISIRDAGLHSIGSLPFALLPNLVNVMLDGNSLTLANISETAFIFPRTGVYLNLERNPGITYLPEEKFGEYVRGNENMIYVGSGYQNECDPTYYLQCDDRIDWICNAGVTRIYGYRCRETGYEDIYDYCQKKFGNSQTTRENLEEDKIIQIADRVRYDTLMIEEDFRRRSVAIYNAKRQNLIHV